jgi:hypothetical protein
MAVARASWSISCDDDHYETAAREAAVDLWILAIEMLRSYEQRRAQRGRSRAESSAAHFEGPTLGLSGGPS